MGCQAWGTMPLGQPTPALGLRQGREAGAQPQRPQECQLSIQEKPPTSNFPPALGTPHQAPGPPGGQGPLRLEEDPQGGLVMGQWGGAGQGVGVVQAEAESQGGRGGRGQGWEDTWAAHCALTEHLLCAPSPPGRQVRGRAATGCCSTPSPSSVITGSGGETARQRETAASCGHSWAADKGRPGAQPPTSSPGGTQRLSLAPSFPQPPPSRAPAPQPQPHPAASGGCPPRLGMGEVGVDQVDAGPRLPRSPRQALGTQLPQGLQPGPEHADPWCPCQAGPAPSSPPQPSPVQDCVGRTCRVDGQVAQKEGLQPGSVGGPHGLCPWHLGADIRPMVGPHSGRGAGLRDVVSPAPRLPGDVAPRGAAWGVARPNGRGGKSGHALQGRRRAGGGGLDTTGDAQPRRIWQRWPGPPGGRQGGQIVVQGAETGLKQPTLIQLSGLGRVGVGVPGTCRVWGGSSRGRTGEQTPRFLGPLLTGNQRQTGVLCPQGRSRHRTGSGCAGGRRVGR